MNTDLFLKKYNLDNNNFINIKKYLDNYLKYKNNLKTFYKRDKKFINLAYNTNFKFCDIMSDFMKELYGLYEFKNDTSILNNLNNDFDQINEKLNNDGFFITKINDKVCDSILEQLNKYNFYDRITKTYIKYDDIKHNKNLGNTFWINKMSDVLNIPEVINLIKDPSLLKIVQNFLECKPILTQTNLWKSINNSVDKNKLSSSAQLFHRDFDHEKWLKIFIYLNDVTEKNGPHCFVKGSHKSLLKNRKVHPSTRESDDFIKQHYDSKNIKFHCGKKGTVVFENTRGYHKGTPVIEGERLILQIEFAINPYCSGEIKNFKLEHNNKILSKFDYIYQIIHK